jgi:hypothetical protein
MNIEEEIVNELAEKMCSEIDFEILSGMLCEMGWTKIILGPMTRETSDAIDHWVSNNIKHPHETRGIVWIFQEQKDAVNFTLRWAN